MESPTSHTPNKLKIRAYVCKSSARKVKTGLQQLVESSPAFNTSWLNGEFDEGTRIGGLDQYGDILVRYRKSQGKGELTIEHRAGDEALAMEIETAFAGSLKPKPPRMAVGGRRPEGMAYFFEMIGQSSLKRRIVIADAVIEEAHDLAFDDYREARAKLDFLSMLSRLAHLQASLDARIQKAYREANVRHTQAKVCLHEGRKVVLRQRLHLVSRANDLILVLHFTKLPSGKMLVGWVEEKPM